MGSINLAEIILEEIPLHADYLLDVGCGTGELTFEMAKRVESTLAIDNDRKSIEEAQSRFHDNPTLKFRVCDALCLDNELTDVMFDCIVSVLAMHHLDVPRTLGSMRKHLKRTGKIVIVDIYANRKGSFVAYILDQLLLSHISRISALFGTVRKIGILKTLSFLLWRLKFALSATGFEHMHEDFLRYIPPSLQEWRTVLQEKLPHGVEKIVMGSVLMYSWDAR